MRAWIVLLFAIAVLIPAVQAANIPSGGGAGGGSCDHYYHQGVLQVAGVISAGDVEVWGGTESCGMARSPSQALYWVGRMAGPPLLGAGTTATQTWSAISPTGCTFSAFTSTSDLFAAALGSSTYATITMTANECRAVVRLVFQVTPAIGAPILFQSTIFIPVNVIVPSQAEYNFLCGSTGTTTNAQDPDAATCNDPDVNVPDVAASITDFTDTLCRPTGNHGHCELDLHGELGVDILNDATDDDMLTVPPATISNISVNGTFPSEIDVNVQGPITPLQELTGLTGMDLFAILIVAFAGVVLWLRATDVGARAFGSILPLVAGIIILFLTIQEGIGTLWRPSIAVAAMLVIVGCYLVVRLFLDDFLEKRAAGEA